MAFLPITIDVSISRDFDPASVRWATIAYHAHARLFYAGLPIPPFATLPYETQKSYIDYAEKLAAKIFNEGFI